MCSPSETTDDVTGIDLCGIERRVECGATERVVDNIETFALRVSGDVLLKKLSDS